MGLGAGPVGAVIWFAIRRIAHLEIGLVAIVLGFFVGKAVRKGSGNRGGRGYQVLAVLLTYCCIAANYMPDVLEGTLKARDKHQAANAAQKAGGDNGTADKAAQDRIQPAPICSALWALVVVAALVFVFSLTVPFLPGAENIIGLLIIGFALWEAWKLNARRLLPISGPYQLGPASFITAPCVNRGHRQRRASGRPKRRRRAIGWLTTTSVLNIVPSFARATTERRVLSAVCD